MSIYFHELTSPEIKQAVDRNTLILLPVGQVEEHGPHLPLETDCLIARDKLGHLGQREPLQIAHADVHSSAASDSPFQAHPALETNSVFRLIPRSTILCIARLSFSMVQL